jgi:predicted Holliday junction resolvase-like endonuclease
MPGSSDVVLLLAFVAAVALLALVLVVFLWRIDRGHVQARVESLLRERDRDLAEARRDSVQKSRSSLKGQIAEQLAPLLPGFRYRPADARFLGDPIDYVVFSGYTAARDGAAAGADAAAGAGGGPAADSNGTGEGLDIVLLEVKQGASSLSPYQRLIARAVQEGRVRFEILRISEDGELSTESWRPRRAGGRDRLP